MTRRGLFAIMLVIMAGVAGCTPAATPELDATVPPLETSTMAAAASLIPDPATAVPPTPSILPPTPGAGTLYECPALRLTELGSYAGLENPRDVAVAGDRVYVTESGGLRVIDASNPSLPVETAFLSATVGYHQILIGDGNAIVAADHSVELIDLSTPDAPARAGSLPISGLRPIQLTWDGGLAAARDDLGVVHILKLTSGDGLGEVSSYDPPGGIWGGEVFGNEMFAKLDRARAMGLVTIALDDEYLYVADLDGGLRVVSLSPAGVPTEVDARLADLSPSNVVRLGSRLFVFSEREVASDWTWRVWQFDLSPFPELAELRELGTVRLAGHTDAASICSYLSAFYSLATTAQPAAQVADDFPLSEVAGALMGVANQGDTLYLLDPERGLVILAVEAVE